jgi:hypothetical protein
MYALNRSSLEVKVHFSKIAQPRFQRSHYIQGLFPFHLPPSYIDINLLLIGSLTAWVFRIEPLKECLNVANIFLDSGL